MSRIDEMIKELCPDGVEMVKLGEIASLLRGKVISKSYVRDNEGDYPVYSSQTANDGEFGRINTYMFDGDYLTWTTDGIYAGTIFRRRGKFSITNICGLIDITTDKISIDFLYYWLSITTTKYVNRAIDNPKLMSNVVELIQIPLPPLSIQQEIVSVLDSFTTLIDKMKQEVEKRKKQMEYYRNELLTFDENTEGLEWKTLGEVCIKTSNIKWKSEDSSAKYQYIDLSSVTLDTHVIEATSVINKENAPSRAQQIVKVNDVILGTTRPTLKRYCLVTESYDNQICSTGFCVFRPNPEFANPKWIYYNLSHQRFWDYCEQYQKGASYPALANSDAFAFAIPFPSLDKQSSIVSTLDKFESYISKLEKMIALRQKQYEYYREQLLTFE